MNPISPIVNRHNSNADISTQDAIFSESSTKTSQLNRILNGGGKNSSQRPPQQVHSSFDSDSPIRTVFEKPPKPYCSPQLKPTGLSHNKLDNFTINLIMGKKNNTSSFGMAEAKHLDSYQSPFQANKGNIFSVEGSKRPHSREHNQDILFKIAGHDEEKKRSFLKAKFIDAKNQEAEVGLKLLPQTQAVSKHRSKLENIIQNQHSHQKLSMDQEVSNSIGESSDKLRNTRDHSYNSVLRYEKQINESIRKENEQMNASLDNKSISNSLKVVKFEDIPQLEPREQDGPQLKKLFNQNSNIIIVKQLKDEKSRRWQEPGQSKWD